jgi:glycosyltransferase involved in cell wall biosynthesis
MKLCIVTHNVVKGDGQGRVNYEVLQEALHRGHHVTLLASRVSTDVAHHPLVNWIDIPVKGFPTQLVRGLIFSQRSAAWLQKHRQEFDLIKVNGALTSVDADVNAAHFIHRSWLQSIAHPAKQHRNLYGAYQWFYTLLHAHFERQAFVDHARLVVAVSKKVEEELLQIGVPQERIKVILNGVDIQEFCPGDVDRQQLGLPQDVTLALFVGDIKSNRKNLDSVLQALQQVPDLHLAVVGDTHDSLYPKLAKTLGVSDRVYFLGYRSDVADIMRAADCFVLPSRYEACTLVLLEAMASGLPVITAATAGGSEIVTAQSGIVLAHSEDISGLVQALQLLAGNAAYRQQMGQQARQVVKHYTWQKMAKEYLDCFEAMDRRHTVPQ